MGRSHAHRGMVWEELLGILHYRYQAAGDANIAKRDPPHTRCRVTPMQQRALKPGQYVARAKEKGEPDYSGGVVVPELYPFAIAVKFDAKQISDGSGRFPFSKLDRAQAKALDAATKAQTFTFIALDLDGTHLVVPWTMPDHRVSLSQLWWKWRKRRDQGQKALPGTASITLEQALAAGARRMNGEGWLAVVRDMLREQLT